MLSAVIAEDAVIDEIIAFRFPDRDCEPSAVCNWVATASCKVPGRSASHRRKRPETVELQQTDGLAATLL
jgi:hypothetical protein